MPEILDSMPLQEMIACSLDGVDVRPSQTHYSGKPALVSTSDEVGRWFFSGAVRMKPDGYIIGIGAGSILSLVRCFPEVTPPRGIVMVDINPHVVAGARIMIDELTKRDSYEEFVEHYFLPESNYQRKVDRLLEVDTMLRDGYQNWPVFLDTPMQAWQYFNSDLTRSIGTPTEIEPIVTLEDYYPLFHALAEQGKMCALYADFTNPNVISVIRALPEFDYSKNIIFLTNMLDMDRRFKSGGDTAQYDSLKAFEQSQKPALFICAPFSNSKCLTAAESMEEIYIRTRGVWR